jgi:hypothetical protein
MLALLSKETAILLPFAIIFYEIILLNKKIKLNSISAVIRNNINYLIVAIIYLYIRFFFVKVLLLDNHYNISIGSHVIENLFAYLSYTFDSSLQISLLIIFTIIIMSQIFLKKLGKNIKILYRRLLIFSIAWYFIFIIHVLLLKNWNVDYYLHTSLFGISLAISIFIFSIYKYLKVVPILAYSFLIIFIFLIIISSYFEINRKFLNSPIYELEEVARNCVKELLKNKISNNDVIFVIESNKGKNYTFDEGVVSKSTAYGKAFAVVANKNIEVIFDQKDKSIDVNYKLLYNPQSMGCSIVFINKNVSSR